MTAEDKLNNELAEIFKALDHALPKKNAQAKRAVGRSKLIVSDVLAKHTSSDGTIPRNKQTAVMSELVYVEGDIYRQLRAELLLILTDVSETTTTRLAEALVAAIGVSPLVEAGVITESLMEIAEGFVEALFWALTGSSYSKHVESTVNSAFRRRDGDGKALNDRIRNIASILHREIQTTIRQSIRKGENTAEILRKVDRIYRTMDWRVDTVTETEALYTMRQAVAKFAEESEIVVALKIVDFPHGDPAEHRRHKCYEYANANEYGLGKGIYPVTARKIRNPHPRCRSALMLVLADEFK